jgi:putative iron-only hydrogenase system regulator
MSSLSLCFQHRDFNFLEGRCSVKTRIALIGIIVEKKDATSQLNAILHEYGDYIIGRMGIPNAKEGIAVISIVLDAPENVISSLAGKIGMLPNISAKTLYSRLP